MIYREIKPTPLLAEFVKCFWYLEAPSNSIRQDNILPDGCMEMILHLGDEFDHVTSTSIHRVPRFLINGQNTQSFDLSPTGRSKILGVRFNAFGFRQFSKTPTYELTDQLIDLTSIFGSSVVELAERIEDYESIEAKVAQVELFLLGRMRKGQGRDYLVENLLHRLYTRESKIRIDEYAAANKISKRQLQRRFKSAVGIDPRLYAKIVRFRNVFNLLSSSGAPSILQVALNVGYYDQSHFIRDFKTFSGETPTAYFKKGHDFDSFFVYR